MVRDKRVAHEVHRPEEPEFPGAVPATPDVPDRLLPSGPQVEEEDLTGPLCLVQVDGQFMPRGTPPSCG
jgi:hypothetical protein